MPRLQNPNTYPTYPEDLEPHDSDDILDTLRQLRLPTTDYFVTGGASLVLRGIKDTTPDLDLLVSDEAFYFLFKKDAAIVKDPPYSAILHGATNKSIWVKNDRTLLPISATTSLKGGYYPMSFDSHKHLTELVQGVPCLLLYQVIAAKEALQRPKDVSDLEIIARSLGRTVVVSANRTTIGT